MYYRIVTRVRIEEGRKKDIWVGMTGTIAYMSSKDRFGFTTYGINLDEADAGGKRKLMVITNNINVPHRRLTRLDEPNLYPMFLNLRSFKFK